MGSTKTAISIKINIFFIETPQAKSIPTQIATKVSIEPKSGCMNIKNVKGAIHIKLLKILIQEEICLVQNEARNKIKTTLANSEGWTLKNPTGIHLIDPLVSIPTIKTVIKSKTVKKYKGLTSLLKKYKSNCDRKKKNSNPTTV